MQIGIENGVTTEIEVSVTGIGGYICTVVVSPSWHISEIKRAIEAETDIPASQQRILHKDSELQNDTALQHVSPGKCLDLTLVRRSPEQAQWLRKIREHGLIDFEKAPEDIRSDPEIVLAAVPRHTYALEYAAEELRADSSFMFQAVCQDGCALEFATDDIRALRSIAMVAVSQTGWALQYTSEDLQSDKDIVMAAVRNSGTALQFASGELRADRDIVTAAVKMDGFALQFAAEALQRDSGLRSLKTRRMRVL